MIVSEVRLLNASLAQEFYILHRGEHGGKVAHSRSIAPIFFGGRDTQAPIAEIIADSPAAGVADVSWLVAHPGHKTISNGTQVPTSTGDQGRAQRKRHFGVIGDTPRFQAEPPTTYDLIVEFELHSNLLRCHKLNRGTQRITN